MRRRGFAVKYPADPACKDLDAYLAGPTPKIKHDPADASLFDTALDAAKAAEQFPIPPGTDGKGYLPPTILSVEFAYSLGVEVKVE